jgi:molybdenum cofactor biosynthesis protein B
MRAMSVVQHRAARMSVSCVVITVSDTRTRETDTGGRAIADRLAADGHQVIAHELVPDEPARIAAVLSLHLNGPAQAVILTGGTGLAPRDTTVDTVAPMFDRRLDGFGELFRMLSYDQVGAAAMLSRACAGVIAGRIVFVLPGSEAAVRLAMDRLILPELSHIVWELSR